MQLTIDLEKPSLERVCVDTDYYKSLQKPGKSKDQELDQVAIPKSEGAGEGAQATTTERTALGVP